MPAMANITVKNAANADVIYVAATPSSGDKTAARWNLNAASGVIGFRPKMQVTTRDSGNSKGARIMDLTFAYPVIETIGGVAQASAVVPASLSVTLPTNVDSAVVNDAFTQLGNLIASTLIRSVAAEGYAPT